MTSAVIDAGASIGEETELATRAAWLYHAGGLTQSEVAGKLCIAPAKAHRLIARATQAGLVRVFVEGPIGNCIALEEALAERHGLALCRVVPGLESERSQPDLRAVGTATAQFLRETFERGEHRIVGVGHGRTLSAAVDLMPRVPAPFVRLVCLLGGLPRRISTGPFDVIHRLAEKTGAEAFLLPVPMVANTPADGQVLRAQRGVTETLALATEASLVLAGIGAVDEAAFLPMAGMIAPQEVRQLRRAGALGELLGRYFGADGTLIETELHDRVIAAPPATLHGLVAVAGGAEKAHAINAVLRSRLLHGLITDEPTARLLVAAAR
jgi:DNA-binding transcriptional regulator LsrR (DeoR family)